MSAQLDQFRDQQELRGTVRIYQRPLQHRGRSTAAGTATGTATGTAQQTPNSSVTRQGSAPSQTNDQPQHTQPTLSSLGPGGAEIGSSNAPQRPSMVEQLKSSNRFKNRSLDMPSLPGNLGSSDSLGTYLSLGAPDSLGASLARFPHTASLGPSTINTLSASESLLSLGVSLPTAAGGGAPHSLMLDDNSSGAECSLPVLGLSTSSPNADDPTSEKCTDPSKCWATTQYGYGVVQS